MQNKKMYSFAKRKKLMFIAKHEEDMVKHEQLTVLENKKI